jgi:1,2-phenylacetyl-CoA epoxidase catalytic subunit
MDSWVARGLCIAFVGLLDVLFEHKGNAHFNFWRQSVGGLVISVGCVYTGLGLLCFRQLKTVAVTKIKRQKIMKEEVHHLTAQKMEIERLLADTESKLQFL